MTDKKINWKKLLKKEKAYCYIKTTETIDKSGYRCFEFGYCTVVDGKVHDKLALNVKPDYFLHISIIRGKIPHFNMDILPDGYIRIFSPDHTLVWVDERDFVVSLFTLDEMEEDYNIYKL